MLAIVIIGTPISAQASRFDMSSRVLVVPAIIVFSVPMLFAFAIRAILFQLTKYKLKWWAVTGITLFGAWLAVVTRFSILFPLIGQ